ncbi:hypothetical protein FOA52_000716 [Chlamydomonas sp. UWO 241]|nr:hypothetical protein FOA52_000716 [Chlamydomonas sp. UWO 241]
MDTECLPAGRAADAEAASNASIAYEDMQLPMLMRSLYGDRLPKFVFVLREPAERVYSAYKGTKELVAAYGNTTNSFISYARDQMKAWTACVAAHGEHACMWHFETLSMEQEKVFYHCDQVLRGLYDEWLKVWFRFFPRENFLFINSHNYFRDPNATRKEVLEFLGLRTPDDATLAVMANASAPVSNVDGPFDWIPEGARRLLQKHIFESHTTKLAKLLAKQGEGPGDDSYDMWDNWNRNDWNRRRGR